MEGYLAIYIDYLLKEGHKSENTVAAYRRDTAEFIQFLKERGRTDPEEIERDDIADYVEALWKKGRSRATMNRKLSSVRSLMSFFYQEGIIPDDLTGDVRVPRVERKEVEFLTIGEIDRLMESPDDSLKGMRDRALLELLYGTGARASEVIDLQVDEINLRIGFFTCNGAHGKARIIPLGRMCREALDKYMGEGRPALLTSRRKEGQEGHLFLNLRGEPLTRQGLWKIVSSCGAEAGLSRTVTPQLLRNSFAVHMLQNGADLKSLQELMGFEDTSALQVYLSATKNRIKEVFDRTHPRA